MHWRTGLSAFPLLAVAGWLANGFPGSSPAPSASPLVSVARANQVDGGWGTIKGRLVWGEDELPKPAELQVTKDQEWCLGKGPVLDETFVVDPKSRGLANVFVFVKNPERIHADYPTSADAVRAAALEEVRKLNGVELDALASAVTEKRIKVENVKAPRLIDQVRCRYIPHALALREGEPVVVLNPEPMPHNVKVSGLSGVNDANPNMPPGTLTVFQWVKEAQPLSIECAIHGWMKMYAMVFDHPYFTVTGADGSFELKNVPAGEIVLIARNPRYIDVSTGGKGNSRGNRLEVIAGQTLDLGEIKVKGL